MTASPAGSGPAAGVRPLAPWSRLLGVALVGTDRRPLDPPASDPAADVLDQAAAWAAYRRVGQRPVANVPRPAPAPAETLAVVPAAANDRLDLLLGSGAPMDATARDAVLVEWLDHAVRSGRRVAPRLLPVLLEYGGQRRSVRVAISAVGGARGRWLAAQNPAWRYLLDVHAEPAGQSTGPTAEESKGDDLHAGHPDRDSATDDASWQLGSPAERVSYLRALRRRAPARARELLAKDWSTLTPDERVSLVAGLAIGLDLADEPVLERALDDRRKEVRGAAAELLTRLPGSAYGERMAARARTCLRVADDGSLAVDPPAEADQGMRRDGIVAKPPSGVGARAWWLEELIAHAPLGTWPEPPTRFVGRPVADGWATPVHRGLARAAAAQRDPGWALAILDVISETVRDRSVAAALYPVLDPDELLDRATATLRDGPTALWGPVLSACPTPWPEPLGRAVLGGLAGLLRRPNLAGELHQLSRLAAVRLPPVLAAVAAELVAQVRESLPASNRIGGLDTMAAILTFRDDMIRELGGATV